MSGQIVTRLQRLRALRAQIDAEIEKEERAYRRLVRPVDADAAAELDLEHIQPDLSIPASEVRAWARAASVPVPATGRVNLDVRRLHALALAKSGVAPSTKPDVPTVEIKRWAVSVGLIPAVVRGSVRREIREAYERAHPTPNTETEPSKGVPE